jgi:hypothetical protein
VRGASSERDPEAETKRECRLSDLRCDKVARMLTREKKSVSRYGAKKRGWLPKPATNLLPNNDVRFANRGPCGFGECKVQNAARKRGHRVLSAEGANVDCREVEKFLKSFREKPGKSGISSTCKRLKGVGKGGDGNSLLPAAPVVFIIHLAPGKAGTHHGCGEFSGVNGTPLLRGFIFTHAPSQAGERMAGMRRDGKLERITITTLRTELANSFVARLCHRFSLPWKGFR